MPVSKVTYNFDLDEIKGVDKSKLSHFKKIELQSRVASFLVDAILRDTANMRSAVDGRRWKDLKRYDIVDGKKVPARYPIEKSKVAVAKANLELTGAMLDSLNGRLTEEGVEVGIFDYDEAQKADNHCKFSAESETTALPKRQFIPKEGEGFRAGIMKELEKIAKEVIDG